MFNTFELGFQTIKDIKELITAIPWVKDPLTEQTKVHVVLKHLNYISGHHGKVKYICARKKSGHKKYYEKVTKSHAPPSSN